MRYKPLSAEFYKLNRKNFMSSMKSKSLAIFNSNDIYPIGADSTFPFQQHRDIFYLSGIDQEESILILFPDAINKSLKEILFIKKTSKNLMIWEGEKLNKKQAQNLSGISSIYWLNKFEDIFKSLCSECETFYFNTNEHYRQNVETQTREDRFIIDCKEKYPAHKTEKSNPILQKLRSIKSNEEISQIQTACKITEKGFRRILNYVKPGVWEYEIEAEFSHEFLKNKSKGFAYSPIIASGKNSNVLHYIQNNKQCKKGDVLLLDVGAEYGNYSSDMTRTIPVSGKFTSFQKKIYQSVLKVKNEATRMLVPGTKWKEYHKEVGEIMTSELIKLKLIDKVDLKNQNPKKPAYKKYFMHGTSHHLGLDTHDYGLLNSPMEANMVFTVEPGIYIPEENFGIRLEDDVVIQKKGSPINLMKNIPIEIEEIEDLMNS